MSASNWQPIETAPKDGTQILLWDGYEMQVCKWGDTSVYGYPDWVYGECRGDYNDRSAMYNPISWQPLPDPPRPPVHPQP